MSDLTGAAGREVFMDGLHTSFIRISSPPFSDHTRQASQTFSSLHLSPFSSSTSFSSVYFPFFPFFFSKWRSSAGEPDEEDITRLNSFFPFLSFSSFFRALDFRWSWEGEIGIDACGDERSRRKDRWRCHYSSGSPGIFFLFLLSSNFSSLHIEEDRISRLFGENASVTIHPCIPVWTWGHARMRT